jgi:hypothetical protein
MYNAMWSCQCISYSTAYGKIRQPHYHIVTGREWYFDINIKESPKLFGLVEEYNPRD